jgi:O-antigen ligase
LQVKARLIHLVAIAGIIAFVLYSNNDDFFGGKPDEVENKETSLFFHASTITDLKTDESNRERLNRWSCAWRMFQDRPLTGFGPGSYEFVYGPYQLSTEMTRISTYEGILGDAHSEFFTALSEQGFPGFALFVISVLIILHTGIKDPVIRILSSGLLCGLFTFFVHSFVNDFLDIEKAAILIFGFMGMIVALDVWHNPGQRKDPQTA